MGFKHFATNVFLTYAITLKSVYADDDYITQLPINLYQSADITPQNADFDKENNKFIAHPGWYNDIEVHYYKFHINGGTSLSEIPVQDFYVMTTDGTLEGAIGNPVIQYFNGGEDVGKGYSDYMNLKLVTVPQDYVADTFKSVGDITTHSDATVADTDIYMNIPVVPNDSTLQHPNNKSELAPINLSTTSPPFINKNVGIADTPYFWAASGLSSTSTLIKLALLPNSLDSSL